MSLTNCLEMKQGNFINQLFHKNRKCFSSFPDKQIAETFADDLFNFLFSSYEGKYFSEEALLQKYDELQNNFSALLYDLLKDEDQSKSQTELFFGAIPFIYQQLLYDAEAIVNFDPAAHSIEEVMVAYPGFYATAIYRIAHQLHSQKVKTLPRILSEFAHSKTGIDIHPGADIGDSFFIDHGTGI